MTRERARPAPRPVALTGTPGTGKSAVATRLRGHLTSLEVGDLALRRGAARRRSGTIEVDLAALRAQWRSKGSRPAVDLVVGHLAHLLPVRDVILLRCRPDLLARRLARAHRGTPATRRENALAEATDVVLLEAIRPGRRVWEIDTTGRTPDDVARAVLWRYRHRGSSAYGRVDWLGDAAVTEHLLDRPS